MGFHETAQEAMYQKKSECLQDMAMAEQVDYMRLAKLTWFMYSPTDTWTNKEIMMALWGMDYADQYDLSLLIWMTVCWMFMSTTSCSCTLTSDKKCLKDSPSLKRKKLPSGRLSRLLCPLPTSSGSTLK